MGCWNETCAVSKMTIYAGEPVRFLPIVQNPYHFQKQGGFPNGESPLLMKGASGVYISDLWVPLCLPIRGEYNDYGTIENVPEKTDKDKAELEQFINAFKKHAIQLDVGENDCHDVKVKNFTLEEILEALQEGRVYTQYRGNGKDLTLVVSWMMIKESVWQSLLETDILKTDDCSFYKMCLKDRPDTLTRKGIRSAVNKQFKTRVEREELEKKVIRGAAAGDCNKEYMDSLRGLIAELRDDLTSGFGGYRSKVWSYAPSQYCPVLNEHLVDTMVDMEYAHSILSLLRINYAPTCCSGSQSGNHKLWKNTMTMWKKIAHKDEHRFDE